MNKYVTRSGRDIHKFTRVDDICGNFECIYDETGIYRVGEIEYNLNSRYSSIEDSPNLARKLIEILEVQRNISIEALKEIRSIIGKSFTYNEIMHAKLKITEAIMYCGGDVGNDSMFATHIPNQNEKN